MSNKSEGERVHMPRKIRLLQEVRGDYPFAYDACAAPGIYEPVLNPHGAVSVRLADGSLLGIKPHEFEWVEGERVQPKDEWLRRYRQRFIDCIRTETMDQAGIEALADDCVKAVSFEEASDGYEDDPEGAADEEMSYWEA